MLRGSLSKAKLKTINGKRWEKLLSQPSECSLVQLCSLQIRDETRENFYWFNNGVNVVKGDVMLEPIQALLKQYDGLFQEPTQLPPHRSHNHKIPLKEGENYVNVRPYMPYRPHRQMFPPSRKEERGVWVSNQCFGFSI